METFLAGLDADQRRAVQHPFGPLFLVAGAGSGKTRVIVARIVRLLREGVPPRHILGITLEFQDPMKSSNSPSLSPPSGLS